MRLARADSAIVLAHGPLRERVAATLTDFVYRNGGRIVSHDQYVDHERGRYFTRLEWALGDFRVPRAAIRDRLADAVGPFELRFELHFSDDVPRVAIFVSKLAYCLYDLIGRWRSGEWRIDIPLVVSNHEELADVARRFDVEFQCFPIDPQNARAQEARELALLSERGIELLVLARYMQILGPELVTAYPNRIINIHHAFLPAFPGARPYDAAHRRGVKIIGATSHYVTEQLDAGPIIEQDIIRVSHATSVEDMIRLGRDLEKVVLARAIWAHIQRKVLVDEGRTVIFG
jgi:formyltetrahydrofolate deformylase